MGKKSRRRGGWRKKHSPLRPTSTAAASTDGGTSVSSNAGSYFATGGGNGGAVSSSEEAAKTLHLSEMPQSLSEDLPPGWQSGPLPSDGTKEVQFEKPSTKLDERHVMLPGKVKFWRLLGDEAYSIGDYSNAEEMLVSAALQGDVDAAFSAVFCCYELDKLAQARYWLGIATKGTEELSSGASQSRYWLGVTPGSCVAGPYMELCVEEALIIGNNFFRSLRDSCGGCGAVLDGTMRKMCKQCRAFCYCDRECQKLHWNRLGGHRDDCMELAGLKMKMKTSQQNRRTVGDSAIQVVAGPIPLKWCVDRKTFRAVTFVEGASVRTANSQKEANKMILNLALGLMDRFIEDVENGQEQVDMCTTLEMMDIGVEDIEKRQESIHKSQLQQWFGVHADVHSGPSKGSIHIMSFAENIMARNTALAEDRKNTRGYLAFGLMERNVKARVGHKDDFVNLLHSLLDRGIDAVHKGGECSYSRQLQWLKILKGDHAR